MQAFQGIYLAEVVLLLSSIQENEETGKKEGGLL